MRSVVCSLAVAVALTASSPLASAAQTPPAAPIPTAATRPPAPSAAELFAGLAITEAQRAELVAITVRARAERSAIFGARAAGSRITAAEHAALTGIAARHRSAFEAVLEPGQRERLAANVERVRQAQTEAIRAARAALGGQP